MTQAGGQQRGLVDRVKKLWGSLERGDFVDFCANGMFLRTLTHGDGLDKVTITSRVYLAVQEVLVIALTL